MSEFKTIEFEQEGEVAQITINRPKALNALSVDVIEEMLIATLSVMNDEARVLVIQSSGDKAFVAGADIKPMLDMTPEQALDFSRKGQMLLTTLEKIPQISIAKVKGFALGGGCELAMGCDLIVATENSQFGQPEVNLGLVAGFGGTQRLVKRVGLPQALDMLLSGKGKTISGPEAFNLGLVSRVCGNDKLDEEANKLIKSILAAGPQAVRETKRLCREALEMSLEAGLSSEASTFASCFASSEAREGISAFLEKKTPKFS
jgi:enoyl-CoA hydratase